MLGITSGRDFAAVKGVIEAIVDALRCKSPLESAAMPTLPLLDPAQSCRFELRRQNARLSRQVIAGRTEAVRSSRADDRGRDEALAAGRGGRPGAALTPHCRPIRP